MLRYVGTPTPVGLVHQAVPEAVVGDGRVQAWVVGPGLDTEADDERPRAQLDAARAALASDLPVVVDAGGLALVDGRARRTDGPDAARRRARAAADPPRAPRHGD